MAVGLLGGDAFMLWGAFIAPKFTHGIGNMTMAFLALVAASRASSRETAGRGRG